MGGMCLCRTCLFSSNLGGFSHQDALEPCERQTSSVPWRSELWTMPIQELHCIVDGDVVMVGPQNGAVARDAPVALLLILASGYPRSIIDIRAPVGSLLAGSRSSAGLGPYFGKPCGYYHWPGCVGVMSGSLSDGSSSSEGNLFFWKRLVLFTILPCWFILILSTILHYWFVLVLCTILPCWFVLVLCTILTWWFILVLCTILPCWFVLVLCTILPCQVAAAFGALLQIMQLSSIH